MHPWLQRLHGPAGWWVGAPVLLGLLLAVSLEEIHDEAAPLDPRYYQGGGTTASVGPGPGQVPFADYEGDLVEVSGNVVFDAVGSVDLDLWKIEPDAPGQRSHLGKIPLGAIGPFSLDVPKGFGALQIEAFRDVKGDGPSADDPFGQVACDVGSESVEGLELVLEVGGFSLAMGGPPGDAPPHGEGEPGEQGGGGPVHVEVLPDDAAGGPEHVDAPPGTPGGEGREHVEVQPEDAAGGPEHSEAEPGAPGGEERDHVEAAPGTPGGDERAHAEAEPGADGGDGGVVHDPSAGPASAPGAGPDPFGSVEGPRVKVRGTLVYADAGAVVDLDVFRVDPAGPGGRAFVGKKKLRPGAFEIELPRSFDKVTLEVFVDAGGDGPSSDDPFAACPCNPLDLSKGDVDGIEIQVQ